MLLLGGRKCSPEILKISPHTSSWRRSDWREHVWSTTHILSLSLLPSVSLSFSHSLSLHRALSLLFILYSVVPSISPSFCICFPSLPALFSSHSLSLTHTHTHTHMSRIKGAWLSKLGWPGNMTTSLILIGVCFHPISLALHSEGVYMPQWSITWSHQLIIHVECVCVYVYACVCVCVYVGEWSNDHEQQRERQCPDMGMCNGSVCVVMVCVCDVEHTNSGCVCGDGVCVMWNTLTVDVCVVRVCVWCGTH